MKITVDRIGKKDLAARIQLLNDPGVNKYLFMDLPVTLAGTISWYNRASTLPRLDLVFMNEEGHCVAMAGLTDIHSLFRHAEFYIFVDPAQHGKGIGAAVTSWCLDYAFFVLRMNKVYLFTDPENAGAVRLYEKLGFVHEGTLRKQRVKDGVMRDKLLYGILREEWSIGGWRQDSAISIVHAPRLCPEPLTVSV